MLACVAAALLAVQDADRASELKHYRAELSDWLEFVLPLRPPADQPRLYRGYVRDGTDVAVLADWTNATLLRKYIGDATVPVRACKTAATDMRTLSRAERRMRVLPKPMLRVRMSFDGADCAGARASVDSLLDYLASPQQLQEPAYAPDLALWSKHGSGASVLHRLWKKLPEPIPYPVPGASHKEVEHAALSIGNGSATPAHYDCDSDVLLVQVAGCRMVIAAPPSATDVLGGNAGHCRQSGPRTTGLGDWSGFEPSCSCEHGGSDGPAALLLHGQPVAGGRVVRMCPGDALHVPSYWWHGAYADVGNLTLTLAFSFPRPERHVAAHARQAGCSQCDMALRPEAGGEAVPELRLEPSRIAPPPPLKPEL